MKDDAWIQKDMAIATCRQVTKCYAGTALLNRAQGEPAMLKKLVRDHIYSRVVVGAINRNDRIGAIHRAWGHVFSNHLRGDYFEFGVYWGDTFVESYRQWMQFHGWLKNQLTSPEEWRRTVAKEYVDFAPTFHGLDTFSGIPINAEDNATFASGTFTADFNLVKGKCDKVFPASDRYRLYQGLFSNTASALLRDVKNKAAIINIDSDIYESAKSALQICSSLLQVGSVVLFDDYNAFCADNRKGERRAFREFQEVSEYRFEKWFSYHYSGQAFLCVDRS